jgi:hypothetical protein
MRLYTDDDERRIRAQREVKAWARDRLLESGQAEQLLKDLQVDLVRTNIFLRVGLAAFVTVVVVAFALLLVEVLHLNGSTEIAILTGILALVSFAAGDVIVRVFRLYRFGVEEALASMSVILAGFSATMLFEGSLGRDASATGLGVAACASLLVYLRFGFVYAALAAIACAALVPSELFVTDAVQRTAAAAIGLATFVAVRPRRLRLGDEWPGDEYGTMQAVAWAIIYLALNVQLSPWTWWNPVNRNAFYWFTYVMTLALPALGLTMSLRDKDRPLVTVNAAMVIVSLITNKPYLGWPRHTWDPILLGLVLIGAAVGLRRWIAKSADGHRDGYTATPVSVEDRTLLTLLSAAPIPVAPRVEAAQTSASPGSFEGGRSGGGGASGGF